MTFDADTDENVQLALQHVYTNACKALGSSTTEDILAELRAVWAAVHRAYNLINEAEADARKAALAKLPEIGL